MRWGYIHLWKGRKTSSGSSWHPSPSPSVTDYLWQVFWDTDSTVLASIVLSSTVLSSTVLSSTENRTISRIRTIDPIALLVAPIFLAIFCPKSSEKTPILMILNGFFGKYGNLGNSDLEKMCSWQPCIFKDGSRSVMWTYFWINNQYKAG